MNEQRLYSIILGPYTTEKTVRANAQGNYVALKVRKDATKPELAKAVEHLFQVKVLGVRMVNVKGKAKAFKQMLGKRSNWKKAYVQLASGQDIQFANFE